MKLEYIQPNKEILDWLLEGDPAIVYQVHRDLLDGHLLDENLLDGSLIDGGSINKKTGLQKADLDKMQARIAESGWGKELLEKQGKDGLWGGGMYSPKWISTHYTLQLMMRFGFPGNHPVPQKAIKRYLDEKFYDDKGINIGVTTTFSDICVTAMVMSMLCYFQVEDERMGQMIEFFESTQLDDGGWNCNYMSGNHHSSVHTTLSVLDALGWADKSGLETNVDMKALMNEGMEFMLKHRLYKSHRTGEPMNTSFTRFSFPPRWFFDVMKALDQFQMHGLPYDDRMKDALELLCKKQKKSGKWPVQNKHTGRVYFDMEKTGSESRWNTLRALRILKHFDEVKYDEI